MKKLFIILFVTTIVFSGCKKYKEGPLISFRTVTMRIMGTWQVTEYISNGVDSLQYYNDSCGANLSINDIEDYDWQFHVGFINGKKEFDGVFNLSKDNKVLYVSSGYDNYNNYFNGPFLPNTKSNWKILKLTNKELKVTVDINNKNYKMSFKKI